MAELQVVIQDANGNPVQIGAVDLAVGVAQLLAAVGVVADGEAVTGSALRPVLVGGQASSAPPAPVSEAEAAMVWLDLNKATVVTPRPCTGTVTPVTPSTTTKDALGARDTRKGMAFYNNSTQAVYLKMGTGASSTSFTVPIQPQGYWEHPTGFCHRGVVTIVWAATATGNVLATEWV